ncbi:DeoR/GlpR transcriptional regulator [Nocardiopsis sp. HNM0947]|uniref:DeoR/GlpR transcriptional regulator n=1 Tax=Nocardiopsis coralli TaxID=2772213 RepID=A0ABR9PBE4_9ACTN|nr:DeoR/GlpR transcriptional regulator [Nocardiopsis coralli]
MEREDRLSRLVDYIVAEGSVRIEEITEKFGVSMPTTRRDLDALASQQLIVRTRGGAMANSSSGDIPLRYRTSRQWREKNAIARQVAQMVDPGSVIAFNGGTTTTAAAFEVGVRAAAEDRFAGSQTTVVTNAVNIANDLIVRPQLRIVVLGGVARMRSYELIGPLTSLILPEITVDTLFLGVTAVDLQNGLFTHDEGEAAVNAELARAARRVIVLADSTKFDVTSFARICELDAVHGLITDPGVQPEAVQELGEKGVEITIA